MSVWKSYRNYDISVWTLQDDYISTLKSGDPIVLKDTNANEPLQLQSISSDNDWPQTRLQGQIQNGSMTLNVDGTMQLSFDIPMYLFINGQIMENPNWYNTINDNILVSMRKIKVIFNKFQTIREFNQEKELTNSVFEFIIMKVQETHENDNLICHIECEGLAFHELGKVGYKRSLTTDEFINEYYEWSIKEVGKGGEYSTQVQKDEDKPINNLQYWMTKAKIDPKPVMDLTNYNVYTEWYAENINPNKWYYEIRMAHTSLVHEQEIPSNQIWEEGFPTDWTDSGDPLNYMEAREKTRLVDINESNLYNITQDLAEKFEVFCKYEYAYDYNYNIIGRTIVFYNNFLKEDDGVETLMYPSSASKISREMDSTNISTKMFIRSVENADLYAGYVNIMDCTANKSREDYLMNFDYLHDIGTISEEQYKEIPKYELKMKELNEQITPLQNAWSNLSELKTTVDAKVTTLTNSIELDEERITENQALIYAIDAADGDADGFITRDYRNPETLTLMKDSSNGNYDTYYVQLNSNDQTKGIQPETLKLYKTYNTTAVNTLSYSVGHLPITEDTVKGWKTNTQTQIILPENSLSWVDYELNYKGTVGHKDDKPDTTSLPEHPKKGWIYYVISNNKPRNSDSVGDILICTNDENIHWTRISAPEGYDSKKGIFIYTRTQSKQMNGPTTEKIACSRKNSTSAYNYLAKIRRLYYVSESSANPAKPTDESSVTDETPIESKSIFDKWSSFITVPEDTSTSNLSRYFYFTTWEMVRSSSAKIYTAVKEFKGHSNDNSKIFQDVMQYTIANTTVNVAESFLYDQITDGTYVYDEYGNLDQINGLFKSVKSGNYFYYKLSDNGYTKSSMNGNFDQLDAILTTGDSALRQIITDTQMPSGKAGKYVLIKQRQYCTNGNVIYSYRFKYYNDNEVFTSPAEPDRIVKEVIPIFYLQTNSTVPTATNAITVVDSKKNNTWTTVLPDKTKSSWIYYSGWKIICYNGDVLYRVLDSNGNVHVDNTLEKAKPTNAEDENAIPKYLYATYKYKPSLYYEKIIDSWIQKKYDDSIALQEATEKQATLKKLIDKIKTQIDELIEEKNTIIAKFEYMMGAALRESYWQPEDEYQNYGSRYEETLKLFFDHMYGNNHSGTFIFNRTQQHAAKFGWDSILLKEEDKLYYESSINQTRVYYPCIDLQVLTKNAWDNPNTDNVPFLQKYYEWATAGAKTEPFAFFFNPTKNELDLGIIAEHTGEQQNQYDIRYNQYYTIGSRAKLAFVRVKNTQDSHLSTVKPVLVLTDTSGLSDPELQNMYENGAVGQLIIEEQDGNFILTLKKSKTFYVSEQQTNAWINVYKSDGKWVQNSNMEDYEIVYPRIIVPSLKMKNNDKDLVLQMNNTNLTVYEDYYVFVKSYYNHTLFNNEDRDITIDNVLYKRDRYIDLENVSNNQLTKVKNIDNVYAITIKPEYLFNHFNLTNTSIPISLKLYYAISNADLSIYLDAKKILKENAYPKVAYDIEVSRWSPKLLNQLHTKLAQIVMINDVDLKFENTFGYISEVKLDLDHEEKDTVEVKNYKTKFEDLFSKIVAETEEMHKNSYNIGAAGVLASGGSVDVTLDSNGFADTLADPSNQEILQNFINEYFDGSEVVQQTLQGMWNEAGQILASAATSLNAVMSTTTQNASILAGFRENVAAALTPNIYTGATQPTTFKPGDIWYNPNDESYSVATGYSGRGGFTKTYNGQLAAITGANVSWDANTGIVDITGETQINLMSGKNVYIAAGDTVDIVGNKAVNIGGTTINMASMNIIGEGYEGEVGGGGIHLVATDFIYDSNEDTITENTTDSGTSRVDITGMGIELASKQGIIIKSGAGINIKSSDSENVSAVAIDGTKGVFIGSNKTVKLYAGTAAEYFYGPYHGATFHKGDYWYKTAVVSGQTNLDENKEQLSQVENYYYINRSNNDVNASYYVAEKDWNEIYNTLGDAKAATSNMNGWTSCNKPEINGASVDLGVDHLLLGVAKVGNGNATVINMTDEEIMLAAGDQIDKMTIMDGQVTDFSNSNIAGLQIKKDYIGMAVGSSGQNNRSLLSLKPTKILTGIIQRNEDYDFMETWDQSAANTSKKYLVPEEIDSDYYKRYEYKEGRWQVTAEHIGPEAYSGSYLWLAENEIYLGTLGHLTVNTNNIKIQTKLLENNKDTNIATTVTNPQEISSTLGFALGKNLQANYVGPVPNETSAQREQREAENPQIGLGFWIDKNDNSHLLVDGSIRARSFELLDNGAYSISTQYSLVIIINGNQYNETVPGDSKPTLTQIQSYANTLTAITNNGTTITVDEQKANIYIKIKVITTIGYNTFNNKPIYSYEHVDVNGVMETTVIKYTTSTSAEQPTTNNNSNFDHTEIGVTWYSNVDDAISNRGTRKFLVTRTQIFQNYQWNTTYTFSKIVDDDQPYVDIIEFIYTLRKGAQDSPPTTPSKPSSGITNTNDPISNSSGTVNTTGTVQWSRTIPQYPTQPERINGSSVYNYYYYYKCKQTHWVNNGNTDWVITDPILDWGLTTAQQNATVASIAAADAATAAEPITAYGIVGKDDPEYEPKNQGANETEDLEHQHNDYFGYPKWNKKTYGLILGNKTELPMLIGSNGGITIADTNLSSGQLGFGSAVVLSGGGIGMHGSTIMLTTADGDTTNAFTLNNNGLTMGTSGNIKLLSSNFTVNSQATNTNNIFFVGDSINNYEQFSSSKNYAIGDRVKRSQSVWEFKQIHPAGSWNSEHVNEVILPGISYSETDGLVITGTVTATAFTLAAGARIPWSSIDNKPTIDFSVDGIGNGYRRISQKDATGLTIDTSLDINSVVEFDRDTAYTAGTIVKRDKNIYRLTAAHAAGTTWYSTQKVLWYVRTVELTSTSALALGANAGVYILRKDNSTLDGSLDTSLAIDKDKINLDFYDNSSAVVASSYIHMNENGISMKGSHIYINGQQEWSRDDIIVMKSGSSQTVEDIETSMAGKHDWVLIRPYYNANINYHYNQEYRASSTSATVALSQTGTNQLSFGDNATWYKYSISGRIRVTSSGSEGASITIKLSNESNLSQFIKIEGSVRTTTTPVDFTITSEELSSGIRNLCSEGTTLYINITSNYVQTIDNLTVNCYCDTTTSRVPCTVYYYP